MSKIAIVTDSTSMISREYMKKPNVRVAELSVTFGMESFKELSDITLKEVIERVDVTKELPKTSQPSPQEFITIYEELSKEYDTILAIHISSKISGTLQNSITSAQIVQEYSPFEFHFFDSLMTDHGMGAIVEKAIDMIEAEKSLDEITACIEQLIEKTRIRFLVGHLDYLKYGGRLSSTKAALGTLLKLKPILTFNEIGSMVMDGKAKSLKKGYKDILDEMIAQLDPETEYEIEINHTFNEEGAMYVKKLLDKVKNVEVVRVSLLGTVISSHIGPESLGIIWRPKL